MSNDNKDNLYAQVSELVTAKTSAPFSKANAKEVADLVLQSVIEMAVADGEFSLPKGYGSFTVKTGRAGKATTPGGLEIEYGPRKRISYKTGAAVKRLLG